jgi:hypothetical protein
MFSMPRLGQTGLVTILLTLGYLVGSASIAAADTVKLSSTISYAKDGNAREKVKSECKLETKVPHFVNEYSDQVELVEGDAGTKGRVLTIEIYSVSAPGGGGMSGSKYMQTKGVLRQDGKQIGNFTAGRYSTGGFLGGYKGTCAILGRCAKAIGKDVANWLKNPTKDAVLGDG